MNISCSAQKKIIEIPSEGTAVIAGYWSPKLGLNPQPAFVTWKEGKINRLTPVQESEHIDGNTLAWDSYYLQPGWIDAHVHLALDSIDFYQCLKNWENPELIEEKIQGFLENYLKLGIVAVRDGGDLPGFSWLARRKVQEGIWPGPRVISVREAVNRQGMYGRFLGRGFDSLTAWHDQAPGFYQQGLDQLKVIVSGLIRFDRYQVVGPTQWTAKELRDIVETAHRRGILVMAHASGEEGISVAIAAGVDSIEHGYYMTGQHLEQMKKQGIAWVPTVAPIGNILKYPTDRYSPQEVDILKRILDSQISGIHEAYQSDVRIGVGTDAGAYLVPHGESLFDEIAWLAQAGIPKLDLFSLLTRENARILGREDLGDLDLGTAMDSLQLAASPL
ncbi:amidohydrolase family protein [Desulfosporosinus sp. PR]|uniref:amidohydrolase family protein n=1 Tax=Candidatus Desulfosporosinus nitrosoreducens TaxID=3401928 RepID=UPI0027ED0888|nr:amidohydrolase family protein [Desulfosporosinus sp. PR]MDQ7095930.1 amidohydrolase family protein [Desulfosporosinus sp. PR]